MVYCMAEKAIKLKTGSRSLETVMFDTLGEYIYELEDIGLKKLTVTRQIVEDPANELKKLLEKPAIHHSGTDEKVAEIDDQIILNNKNHRGNTLIEEQVLIQ